MESSTINVGNWLKMASQGLGQVENPQLEAQLILGKVLALSRSRILAHPEILLDPSQIAELAILMERRTSGEPLPYILGTWEFFNLTFMVSPAVLIPRPETELLVEKAIDWLLSNPDRRRAADVGIGSGAVATALLVNVLGLQMAASDISRKALQIARQNLTAHHVFEAASLVQCDLLSAMSGPFDLVCANLPYIPSSKLAGLDVAQNEPWTALDGGPDGLLYIEQLTADANRWLAPGGMLMLEIEADQGESAPAMMRRYFPTSRIELFTDLAGLPRVVTLQR